MKILNKKEKAQIIEELENYGIEQPNYLFLETGREKIRGYSGNLSRDELANLERNLRVEIIGLFLFRKEKEGLRLSLDACHLLKPKNKILEINNEQAELWMKGQDLQLSTDLKGFVIIKNKDNFLGCGKVAENKILNFIPKERRTK